MLVLCWMATYGWICSSVAGIYIEGPKSALWSMGPQGFGGTTCCIRTRLLNCICVCAAQVVDREAEED